MRFRQLIEDVFMKHRVLVVGAARESTGGVTTVLNLCEKMPMWKKWQCYWLGTQLHGSYGRKAWYAFKAIFRAIFIIWKYDIVHFHTTPDKGGLLIQLPILIMAKIGRKKAIMHIHVGNQLNDNTENKFFIWWMQHCDVIVLLAKNGLIFYHRSTLRSRPQKSLCIMLVKKKYLYLWIKRIKPLFLLDH